MSNRTVKVDLELDVARYRGPARGVVADTKAMDVAIKSLGDDIDHMSASGEVATVKVRDLGVKAERAGEQIDTVATTADRATDTVGGLGEGMDKTAVAAGKLDAQLADTRARIRELIVEFDRTGDVALLGQLRKDQGALANLTRLRGELSKFRAEMDDLSDASSEQDLGRGLSRGIAGGVRDGFDAARGELANGMTGLAKVVNSNPYIGAGIAAAIVAAIPAALTLAGPAIATGVQTGLGGGVLALGVSRAVQDQRVADAWRGLGDVMLKQLDQSSARMVGPMMKSAETISNAFKTDIAPSIDRAIASMTPMIDQLSVGFAGFVRELGPGFDKAMASAGPFIEILAEELPYIGAAISSFLGHLANAGPGAQQFFQDVLIMVEATIRALGWLIEYGSRLYMLLTAIGQAIQGDFKAAKDSFDAAWNNEGQREANEALAEYRKGLGDTSAALGLTTEKLAALSMEMGQTEVTVDRLSGQMAGKLFDSMMSLDQAALSVAESQSRVTDAIKSNGRELDIHTEKGQRNREAILGAVQANMAQYKANIDSGMSSSAATAAYEDNTRALEKQMRAAGLTQGQIDSLIGKYRNVPRDVDTDIQMHGLEEAIRGLDDTLRRLNGLPSRKDISVVTSFVQVGKAPPQVSSGNPRAVPGRNIAQRYGGVVNARSGLAAGIYSEGADIVHFAEQGTGGELYLPLRGISQQRAASLLNVGASRYGMTVGGGGGGNSYIIHVHGVPGTAADVGARVVEQIKSYERMNGSSWRQG